MKYLLNCVETYRVETENEAKALQETLSRSPNFTLANFGYKVKYVKSKGEIVDEYWLVTVKKVFNDEKEPETPYYEED